MMRFIRFGILALVVLFVVMTLLSLLFPSRLRVTRMVSVGAPREKILAAVGDLRSWPHWNTFTRALNNKTWSSPSAGKGAWLRSDELSVYETAASTDSIALIWDLKGGKQYPGGFELSEPYRDSIVVVWWFDLHFRWYPWEKLGVLVYDRKLGPAMEESLIGLKQYLENSR